MRSETAILEAVVKNEELARKILPYLKPEYFSDRADELVFRLVSAFHAKYHRAPTLAASLVNLGNLREVPSEDVYKRAHDLVQEIFEDREPNDSDWVVEEAERFCQDRALRNAIIASARILEEGPRSKTPKTAIPQLVRDALGVNFDARVGHDYLEDSDDRWGWYTSPQNKIPFRLSYFNKITNGGVRRKSFNVLMGGTGVGKSLALCSLAADYALDGLNVLYITLELSEEQVAERIDANLLDVSVEHVREMREADFRRKIGALRERTGMGRILIHEYPTAGAGAGQFRYLYDELAEKKGFVPTVTIVDQLTNCQSSRIGLSAGSYSYVKAVGEELRGLAFERNQAMWSVTQLNREGLKDSDPNMGQTSESIATAFTADLMLIMSASEEMIKLNQAMIKQTTKNRYGSTTRIPRFVVGCDRDRQRLFNVEETAQTLIDTSSPGTEHGKPVLNKKSFDDFF